MSIPWLHSPDEPLSRSPHSELSRRPCPPPPPSPYWKWNWKSTTTSRTTTMPPWMPACRSQIARLESPGASTEQLARALRVLGAATLFVGVNAGLHRLATTGSVFARHEAAYCGIVAAVLAAVPVEMVTAFWLPRSDGRPAIPRLRRGSPSRRPRDSSPHAMFDLSS
ncbi:hypothetical protein ZWY2020_031934 [Hordeum vulgare]|nr:hypothetical protein ZWY2020_031934 [Hordeum vulgare]